MAMIYQFLTKTEVEQQKIVVENLDTFIEITHSLGNQSDYVYRGISANNQIFPNLIRDGNNLEKEEFDILKDFENNSIDHPNHIYSCWDFVAMAQHYRKSTRLIDFTYDINVAAFFALNRHKKEKDDRYLIYVANRKHLTRPEDIKDDELPDYLKKYKLIDMPTNYPFTDGFRKQLNIAMNHSFILLEAHNSNLRIKAQKGLFVIPNYLSKETIEQFFSRLPIVIEISDSARAKILRYLKKHKYTEKSLQLKEGRIKRFLLRKLGFHSAS